MIESGSHHPGIDVAAWRLPEGTAIRYERPAPGLRALMADYAVLDSDVSVFNGDPSWLLPGPAKLWFTLTAPDLLVKARNRPPAMLGAAMLLGPASMTMPVKSHGGISIVIEPTPRGWSRLFDVSAEDMRDRIVPLDQLRPPTWTVELLARLHASDRGAEVKGVLDDFLTDQLPPPGEQEELIGRIERLLGAPEGERDVSTWHAELGVGSARTVSRACDRYFGFAPKLLQRRRRFLRAFSAMLVAAEPLDHRVVPPGYHDVPHFLRDARHFLGMTARQFLAMPMLYLRAALRARTQVIGAPLSLFDRPAPSKRR